MMTLMLCRNQCNLKYFQRLVSPLSSFRGYHSKQGVYGFKPLIHTAPANNAGAAFSNLTSFHHLNFALHIYVAGRKEGKFESCDRSPNLLRLVEAYQRHGHLKAALDPLHLQESKY